ncbi:helix-turn-helix domain-containing protein [Streptococcus sp. H31]|uniref:helix-turn-helix domain-containing protein n=1 Tax=Streptococcus huangxiaojuni TaxID=3237239 RepID=UPI0034A1FFCD
MSNKTIGEILKDARIRQGLSLEDVEAKTDIPSHHLLALELDQFNLIPDEKTLNYIQRYGETVDLHPIALKQQYREQIQHQESETDHFAEPVVLKDAFNAEEAVPKEIEEIAETDSQSTETVISNTDKEPELSTGTETKTSFANRSRRYDYDDESYDEPSRWPIIILSLVAILILLFVGYTVWHQLQGNRQTSQASQYWSVSSSTEQETTSVSTDSQATLSVEGSGRALTAYLSNASDPVEIVVSLSGAESSWFYVSNSEMSEDGVTLNSATPSYTVSLPASTATATITLSVVQGVTITVDGQVLDTSALTGSDLSYITLNIQ